jgi:hypothetical protein
LLVHRYSPELLLADYERCYRLNELSPILLLIDKEANAIYVVEMKNWGEWSALPRRDEIHSRGAAIIALFSWIVARGWRIRYRCVGARLMRNVSIISTGCLGLTAAIYAARAIGALIGWSVESASLGRHVDWS